ncbi:MAG: hypothetical protein ACFFCW_38870 [Candidatus Hodarchaeota archaeon]
MKNRQRVNAAKILADVSQEEAFHLHTDIGAYTGKFATSLANLAEMLETVDLKTIEFHVERKDLENWIKHLGDNILAMQVARLRKRKITGENLRIKLIEITKRRVDKLRAMLE